MEHIAFMDTREHRGSVNTVEYLVSLNTMEQTSFLDTERIPFEKSCTAVVVVCWLLNVPETH